MRCKNCAAPLHLITLSMVDDLSAVWQSAHTHTHAVGRGDLRCAISVRSCRLSDLGDEAEHSGRRCQSEQEALAAMLPLQICSRSCWECFTRCHAPARSPTFLATDAVGCRFALARRRRCDESQRHRGRIGSTLEMSRHYCWCCYCCSQCAGTEVSWRIHSPTSFVKLLYFDLRICCFPYFFIFLQQRVWL